MRRMLSSYVLMMKWQMLSAKIVLPFVLVIQLIIAVGTVFGLGFMYPNIDTLSAKYIVTGATMMTRCPALWQAARPSLTSAVPMPWY